MLVNTASILVSLPANLALVTFERVMKPHLEFDKNNINELNFKKIL